MEMENNKITKDEIIEKDFKFSTAPTLEEL